MNPWEEPCPAPCAAAAGSDSDITELPLAADGGLCRPPRLDWSRQFALPRKQVGRLVHPGGWDNRSGEIRAGSRGGATSSLVVQNSDVLESRACIAPPPPPTPREVCPTRPSDPLVATRIQDPSQIGPGLAGSTPTRPALAMPLRVIALLALQTGGRGAIISATRSHRPTPAHRQHLRVEADLFPHHALEFGRAEPARRVAQLAVPGHGDEVRVGDEDARAEVLRRRFPPPPPPPPPPPRRRAPEHLIPDRAGVSHSPTHLHRHRTKVVEREGRQRERKNERERKKGRGRKREEERKKG